MSYQVDNGDRPEKLPKGIASIPFECDIVTLEKMPPSTVWVVDADTITVSEEGFAYCQPLLPADAFFPETDEYAVVVRMFEGYVLDTYTTLDDSRLKKKRQYTRVPNEYVSGALDLVKLEPFVEWVHSQKQYTAFVQRYEEQFGRSYKAEFMHNEWTKMGEDETVRLLALKIGKLGLKRVQQSIASIGNKTGQIYQNKILNFAS